MPRWLVALVRAPLVLLAWLTRRIVGWLLRVGGYQKTCRLLASISPSPDPAAGLIRRAGRAWSVVRVALSRDPLRPGECVERSLTLWWLLRWIGVHSVVRSGIRREPGGNIIAHAWVEVAGEVVNDSKAYIASFAPLWPDTEPESIARRKSRANP